MQEGGKKQVASVTPDRAAPDKELDTRGEVCPFPWVKAKRTLKKLELGQVLRILGDHMVQGILRRRRQANATREHAFVFEKKFLLNDEGYLSWHWELKIQAAGYLDRSLPGGP